MQIDVRDSHDPKAPVSMKSSLESGVNTNVARDVHPSKHIAPSKSTDDGREIDFSDLQPENAFLSIRRSFESGSNETLLREAQDSKHDSPRISTSDGT
jgi:hypothetical protein